MIQLSIQPGTETAKPTKTAASGAASGGLFASVLEGQMPAPANTGGKLLPGGGKDLPVDPAIAGKAEQIVQANATGDLAKLAAETALQHGGESPESKDIGTQPALKGEAEADTPESELEAPSITTGEITPVLAIILPVAPQALVASALGDDTPNSPAHGSKASPLPAVLPPATSPDDAKKEQPQPSQGALPKLAPAAHEGQAKLQAGASAALPESSNETAKPAEAPDTQKDQAGLRLPLARQIRIDLAQDAKPKTVLAATEGHANERTVLASALSPSAPLTLGDGTMPAQAQNAARITAQAPAAPQPHDFSALVDRLVEARDAARPQTVSVALIHADFGEVSLRFNHDDRGLTVSMANHDPEFARAVSNAMPAERAPSNDAMAQHARRDDGAQQSLSRGTGDSAAAGNGSGSGEGRNKRDPQRIFAPIQNNASRQASIGKARGGIFA